MRIQPDLTIAPAQPSCVSPAVGSQDRPKRRPPLLRLMLAMVTGLAVVTLSIIGAARVSPVSSFLTPQQYLLPGGSLPSSATCLPPYFHRDDCRFAFDGQEVGVTYDTDTGAILRIVVSGQVATLGELILAWGTPTGLTHAADGCSLVVFWDTDAAQLYTCALQPSSPIAYIEYLAKPQPRSPWRGFSMRPLILVAECLVAGYRRPSLAGLPGRRGLGSKRELQRAFRLLLCFLVGLHTGPAKAVALIDDPSARYYTITNGH